MAALEHYNDLQVPEGTTKEISYGGVIDHNTPEQGID